MRKYMLVIALLVSAKFTTRAQSHGTVYGSKPNRVALVQANKLEAYLGRRSNARVTVAGRVAQVTNPKGGWFDVDAGNGKIITAHFINANVNIPKSLKNRYIIMDGIAQKQMIADQHQHYAGGDSRGNARQAGPRQMLVFAVKGLAIDK